MRHCLDPSYVCLARCGSALDTDYGWSTSNSTLYTDIHLPWFARDPVYEKPPSRISLSYTSADRVGAEWIAWQLEEVGYQVKIQAWDFSPGANFVVEMQKATVECDRTIAVFSANYFLSEFAEAEWTAAFRLDPTVKTRSLFRWALRIANLQASCAPSFTSIW